MTTLAPLTRRKPRGRTGPRTASGKKIASRNALLHGLSVQRCLDSRLRTEIQHRANLLAGEGASPIVRIAAERVAAAEIELEQITRVRHQLYQQAFALEGRRAAEVEQFMNSVTWPISGTTFLGMIQRHATNPHFPARKREWFKQKIPLAQQYAAADPILMKAGLPAEPDRRHADGETVPVGPSGECINRSAAITWLMPRLSRLDRYSRRAHAQYRRAMEIWRLANL